MRESRKPPSFKRAKPEDSNESSGFLLVVGHRALVLFVWYMALCLLQGVVTVADTGSKWWLLELFVGIQAFLT